MTRDQAIKIIRKAILEELQRLSFGANLYEAGVNERWTAREHKARKAILEAMAILEAEHVEEDGAQGQTKLPKDQG